MCDFMKQDLCNDECFHPSTMNNDEGFYVCIDCGLVIEQAFDNTATFINSSSYSEIENYPGSSTQKRPEYNAEMILFETCHRYNLANIIFYQAKKAIKTIRKRKLKISSDVVAATALFETLTRMNVPRTADEVCSMFNISQAQLWNNHNPTEIINSDLMIDQPIKMGERFAALLNLPFKDLQQTFKKLAEFSKNAFGGYRPQSLAAAAIFSFTRNSKAYRITLDRISEVTGVSKGCIRKLANRLFSN
jgi:transcription initiation factor TFIIIB Brf1 subunit/transcription initiation factor TFIIB